MVTPGVVAAHARCVRVWEMFSESRLLQSREPVGAAHLLLLRLSTLAASSITR